MLFIFNCIFPSKCSSFFLPHFCSTSLSPSISILSSTTLFAFTATFISIFIYRFLQMQHHTSSHISMKSALIFRPRSYAGGWQLSCDCYFVGSNLFCRICSLFLATVLLVHLLGFSQDEVSSLLIACCLSPMPTVSYLHLIPSSSPHTKSYQPCPSYLPPFHLLSEYWCLLLSC